MVASFSGDIHHAFKNFAFNVEKQSSYTERWEENSINLTSDSRLLKKFIFICLNESSLKMMKNAFYFVLKALFVLKLFKFLS